MYPGIGWLVFREKALVKETLGRQQVDRLADDITEACATLQEKGGAHPSEREQVKRGRGPTAGARATARDMR